MPVIQKYGIKFPINIVSEDMTLFDLNTTKAEKVKSELMHVIFTQKGQRLRFPDFGTNLLQFIFDPNDSQTWDNIKFEIKECVKKYVPDCSLQDIEIFEQDEGRMLIAAMKYTVTEDDGSVTTHDIATTL